MDLFVEFCKTEKQNQKKILNCKFPLGLASLYCENIGPNTNQLTEKDGWRKAWGNSESIFFWGGLSFLYSLSSYSMSGTALGNCGIPMNKTK